MQKLLTLTESVSERIGVTIKIYVKENEPMLSKVILLFVLCFNFQKSIQNRYN